MKIFYLPDLGEGLAEAEIREWYVKEGDTVKVDQPLLSVETAKAVVDVPSPYDGTIRKLHGQVHEMIKTQAPLVEFEGQETSSSTKKDKGSIVGQLEETQQPLQEDNVIIGTSVSSSPIMKILPVVRALAKQLNVDLSSVTPSGPKGQITAEDVKRQAKLGKQSSVQGEALHGVRRIMALTMMQSHQEIVPVTITDDADVGHFSPDADFTVYLLRAISAGIKAEPALNAWFDGKTLERQLFTEINIGLAIDATEGLFVPVLKNIEKHSDTELRTMINHFKEGVRSRSIAPSDMQGATIILSNFGTIAGKYANPIIVSPMVAILGCGGVRESVVAREGKAVVSRIAPLSLTTDHRAVTGGEAARFLAAVIKFLQS